MGQPEMIKRTICDFESPSLPTLQGFADEQSRIETLKKVC
jgi:hypothetical protein